MSDLQSRKKCRKNLKKEGLEEPVMRGSYWEKADKIMF